MSDDKKGSDEQQKPAEAATESGKDGQTPKVWADDEVRKIIEDRDKAKHKLRKIDEDSRKAEEQKAIEEGRLKEVLAQREQELEQLRKFKEAKDAEENAIREAALAKLSDDDKEIAAELSTAKLLAYVEKQTKTPAPFSGKGKPPEAENPIKAKPGESYESWQRRVMEARSRK